MYRIMLPCHPPGLVVLGRQQMKELFDAPDDIFNFLDALLETLDLTHNVFKGDIFNVWHHAVVRNQLTQSITAATPMLVDELAAAIKDELDSVITEGCFLHLIEDLLKTGRPSLSTRRL